MEVVGRVFPLFRRAVRWGSSLIAQVQSPVAVRTDRDHVFDRVEPAPDERIDMVDLKERFIVLAERRGIAT